jgi:hypothetical protein
MGLKLYLPVWTDLAVEGSLVCVDTDVLDVVALLVGPVGAQGAGPLLRSAVHVPVPRHLILPSCFLVIYISAVRPSITVLAKN